MEKELSTATAFHATRTIVAPMTAIRTTAILTSATAKRVIKLVIRMSRFT